MCVERTVRGWPAMCSRARIWTAGSPAIVVAAVLICSKDASRLREARTSASRAAWRVGGGPGVGLALWAASRRGGSAGGGGGLARLRGGDEVAAAGVDAPV